MMLPPRRRISPASPAGTSWRWASTMRSSKLGRGRPDRRGDRLRVVAGRGGRRGAALGEAVPGDHHGERQLVEDAADELDRDVGGTGDGDAQAREVVVAAARVVEDRLVDRRRARAAPSPCPRPRAPALGRRRTPARGASSPRPRPTRGCRPSARTCGSTGSPSGSGRRWPGRSWPPSRWPPAACGRGSAPRPSAARSCPR